MKAIATRIIAAGLLLGLALPAEAASCDRQTRRAFEQLLIVKTPADEGDALDRFADWVAGHDIAGIFLSRRSVRAMRTPTAVRAFVDRLQAGRDLPLLVSIDQEGGARQSLGPDNGFAPLPRVADLCRTTADAAIGTFAETDLAAPIAAVGVNMNFAPVLDVALEPNSEIIVRRGRACSSDPDRVAGFGVAMLKGQDAAGVISVAKHYPGHGNVSGDTHKGTVRLTAGRAQLDATDLVPFRAFIRAGGPAIMVAHIIVEAVDADAPASLSHKVITGLLRGEHGFRGVVITDDLSMRAVTRHTGGDLAAAVVAAVRAGADLMPIGSAAANGLLRDLCTRYEAAPGGRLGEAFRAANARSATLRNRLRRAASNPAPVRSE